MGDHFATSQASGAKYFTLAFLRSTGKGSCTLAWNGLASQPLNYYAADIASLRTAGGDVIPSFGGYSAGHSGTEIADSCTNVQAIAADYESVITTLGVTAQLWNMEGMTMLPGIDDWRKLMPEQIGSPLVGQRRLAAELRRLRERMGLTADEVAKELSWSASKLSRFELARSVPKTADLGKLLDRYGVATDRRAELFALADEATGKGWWEAYSDVLPDELASLIGMEAEARSSWIWHVALIPGLLQTREYAREVNRGFQRIARIPPPHMERRLEARLARQQILTREPPFELSVVLDESALR